MNECKQTRSVQWSSAHLLLAAARLLGGGVEAVDVVHDGQQVVGHRLERELVQQRRDRIEAAVQNQEQRAVLLRALRARRARH